MGDIIKNIGKVFHDTTEVAGDVTEVAVKLISTVDTTLSGILSLNGKVYDKLVDWTAKDPLAHPNVAELSFDPNDPPKGQEVEAGRKIDEWREAYVKDKDKIDPLFTCTNQILKRATAMNERRINDIKTKEDELNKKRESLSGLRYQNQREIVQKDSLRERLAKTEAELAKRLRWRMSMVSNGQDTSAIDRDIAILIQTGKSINQSLAGFANSEIDKEDTEILKIQEDLKTLYTKKVSFTTNEWARYSVVFFSIIKGQNNDIDLGTITTKEVPIEQFIKNIQAPFDKINKLKNAISTQITRCDAKKAELINRITPLNKQ